MPCRFILSAWHSNEFRISAMIERHWIDPGFHLLTREHFYHVGSTEDLRHPMINALITNFSFSVPPQESEESEQLAFFERPMREYSASRAKEARS